MLIGKILAKVLALTDYFLSFFAAADQTAGINVGLSDACGGNIVVYNTAVTACGQTIIGTLVGTTELLLAALNGIMSGVLAY
jgi:hypothetical protein